MCHRAEVRGVLRPRGRSPAPFATHPWVWLRPRAELCAGPPPSLRTLWANPASSARQAPAVPIPPHPLKAHKCRGGGCAAPTSTKWTSKPCMKRVAPHYASVPGRLEGRRNCSAPSRCACALGLSRARCTPSPHGSGVGPGLAGRRPAVPHVPWTSASATRDSPGPPAQRRGGGRGLGSGRSVASVLEFRQQRHVVAAVLCVG